MLRIPALACTALFIAAPVAALDIRTSKVPGRGDPGLCATDGDRIVLNRADRTLALCDASGAPSVTTLLTALPSGRRAVEQGRADDLMLALPSPSNGTMPAPLATLFTDAGRSALFGVRCDGASGTDNTSAINRMVLALTDAVLPPGVCRITGRLTVPAGRTLRAHGRSATTLAVRPDFDMAADAVVGLGRGSRLSDLLIDFAQPDSGLRAQWTRYPTAISALGSGGEWTIDEVRVQRATKALEMRGEQQRAKVGTFEASFSEMGVDIDGTTDSVRFGTLRFWSYGLTPAQYGVVIDRNQAINGGQGLIGLNTGRIDGLIIDQFFSIFYDKAIRAYYSTGYAGNTARNGITTGLINKLQLDTTGGFFCEWCDLTVAAAYINLGAPGYSAMVVRGGNVNVGQLSVVNFGTVDFRGNPFPATDVPMIQIDNNSTQPRVTIAGLNVEMGDKDRTLLQTASPNGGNATPILNIAGVAVQHTNGTGKAYTKPLFDLPVGIGSILGLTLGDLTARGSKTVFAAPADIPVMVLMSPATGYTLGVPDHYRKFTVNFGFKNGSLTLPSGSIFARDNVTSGGALVGASGLFTGNVASPVQVVDQFQNVTAAKFGANGAAPQGKCTLPAALPTDGSATSAASASAINALRACLIAAGLAQ